MKAASYLPVWLIGALAGDGVCAETAVRAEAIAMNCLSCHGESDSSAGITIPGLDRLERGELRQALLDFKYGGKPGTLMPRLAKGYSDDELAAVAEFIAGR